MAVVEPFQAWRYSLEKHKNLEEVVVPPYDVISTQELKRLQSRTPYNYSHVILNNSDDKYAAASQLVSKWRKSGDLIQDRESAFYLYAQTFELQPTELFCQNYLIPFQIIALKKY